MDFVIMSSSLNKQDICGRLPHAGAMCLLGSIVSFDESSIRCVSNSHLNQDNPLRRTEGLSSINGIEYAAQAMALHSSLIQDLAADQTGYMSTLRNIKINQQWLDCHPTELIIDAHLLGSSFSGIIYDFILSTDQSEIISGRATIMTNIGKVY
ncbi:MAG: hypothetical protein KZQ59_17265 [Candidatus Thiodiazotropha sp. (ex Lucinoma aequizonata)]|nr:hypothetical protein [Candidatus Thiodiazotropha sp. (ex Lucinoma aequizonata)]MCU7900322.1 hypothetical protein [Candidatus Thiodiazotropha sp. (ex Lucinoma aequizonata)]